VVQLRPCRAADRVSSIRNESKPSAVAAGYAEWLTAGQHPRADDHSLLYGLLQRQVQDAVRTDVTHRGNPFLKR
jgi:hypothetical protein